AFANMNTAIARGMTKMIAAIDKSLEASGLPKIEEIITKYGDSMEKTLTKLASKVEATDMKTLISQVTTLSAVGLTLAGSFNYLNILPGMITKSTTRFTQLSGVMRGTLKVGDEGFKSLDRKSQKFVQSVDRAKNMV